MIIGLTGGTGSGKSTVAEILRFYGYTVVDADKVSREVTEKGSEAGGRGDQIYRDRIRLVPFEARRQRQLSREA